MSNVCFCLLWNCNHGKLQWRNSWLEFQPSSECPIISILFVQHCPLKFCHSLYLNINPAGPCLRAVLHPSILQSFTTTCTQQTDPGYIPPVLSCHIRFEKNTRGNRGSSHTNAHFKSQGKIEGYLNTARGQVKLVEEWEIYFGRRLQIMSPLFLPWTTRIP